MLVDALDDPLPLAQPARVEQHRAGPSVNVVLLHEAPHAAHAHALLVRLMKASRPETPAREVLKILRDNNIPGVPVVGEDGKLEGFVTDGHLMNSALPRTNVPRPMLGLRIPSAARSVSPSSKAGKAAWASACATGAAPGPRSDGAAKRAGSRRARSHISRRSLGTRRSPTSSPW